MIEGKSVLGRRAIIIFLVLFSGLSVLGMWPPQNDIRNQIRSSELHEVVHDEITSKTIEYVDDFGNITYAADKYCAVIKRTKKGNTVTDEFLDENGNLTKQRLGYYAIRRDYNDDGDNYRLTYLNSDGKPMIIESGYATIERSYNDIGEIELEFYYDLDHHPIKSVSYENGCLREYDRQGRNTTIVYLDINKCPVMTKHGYAILHRTFYETGSHIGKVEKELYFDVDDNPIANSHGEYGILKEYDWLGRASVLTYLGKDGTPIVAKDGVTVIKRTFYPNDSIKTEFYYDKYGNPVALSQGQYGVLYENRNVIFLHNDGSRIFNLRNFLYLYPNIVIVFALGIVFFSIFIRKKQVFLILLAYITFICYMTLMYRTDGNSGLELTLFWSYAHFFSSYTFRCEILNNIWLFIPLGTILYKIRNKSCILFIPILGSVFIEIIQYSRNLGFLEIDDVISNGLGSGIGFLWGYALDSKVIQLKERIKILKICH